MRPRLTKYGASKTACAWGHMHDSKKEARRCAQLHVLQAHGEIRNLKVQHQYWFEINGKPLKHLNGRRAGFKVDFTYDQRPTLDDDFKPIAEDAKGFIVRDYPLRSALFRALFPDIELREV